MWFEHALNREQIRFIFNNELPIENIEFRSFDFSGLFLSLYFTCKKMPRTYPDKWKKQGVNALTLGMKFIDIDYFNATGNKVGFLCSPNISITSEKAKVEIISESFHLECIAKNLSIDGITPYIDERWD